jgi:CheY-like chemotaxis protein
MDFSFPILVVGDAEHEEFQAAAVWLRNRGAVLVDDFPGAVKLLTDGDFSPALIVLVEFSPPRFSNRQLLALRHAAPLARIVRLLGPWFEGEVRTGQPLPAEWRIYWHQWAARLQRQVELWQECQKASSPPVNFPWSLPNTAGEDERLSTAAAGETATGDLSSPLLSLSSPAPAPLIAVVAEHREAAQVLCDLCVQRGWKSVWLRTPPVQTPLKVDAIIFDSIAGAAVELKTVAALQTISGGAPLIVLQGFPRSDDMLRWQSAGVSALVSKPFMADDLLWQIAQFLPQPVAAG